MADETHFSKDRIHPWGGMALGENETIPVRPFRFVRPDAHTSSVQGSEEVDFR
jgi:phage gpG-like protein